MTQEVNVMAKIVFDFPETIDIIPGTVVHTYIIKRPDAIIQIDAGIQSDFNKIRDYYSSTGNSPDYVLITAVDYIHVGALREIYDTYNPKIYVPKRGMGTMKNGPNLKGILEIEGKGLRFDGIQHVYSYNKMELDFLGVIDTPGYSQDNVSLYYKDKNTVFVGDAFTIKRQKFKIDQMFTQNMEDARASMEKIKSLCPVTILPSHGELYNCP